MPTVKIDQVLFMLDGVTPMKNNDVPITLKEVITDALMAPNPDMYGQRGELIDKGDDDKTKFKKWELFKKVRDAESMLEIKHEDIVFILKWIGKYQSQLVYGQCTDYLEQ